MDNLKKIIGKKLRELRDGRDLNRQELADILGVSYSTVRDWESGKNSISLERLEDISEKLLVSKNYFLDEEVTIRKDEMIPILGTIRAGFPVLAQENILGYVKPPEGISVDFALIVEGDSMIPVYYPGTLVYIRQQPIAKSNEIAVVLVKNEDATLKRIRFKNGTIQLISFNVAKYDVMEHKPENIKIIGKVVYP